MRVAGGMLSAMALMLAACDKPAVQPNTSDPATIERGRAAAARLGCGACHTMPGVDWPQGKVGPALAGFGDRAVFAGRLPNRPEMLARFVTDAPSLVPGTAMPAVPMSDQDAQDIAAWLQSLHAR